MQVMPSYLLEFPLFTTIIKNYYVSFRYDGDLTTIKVSVEHTQNCKRRLTSMDGIKVTIGQGDDYTIVIVGDVSISVPDIQRLTNIQEFCKIENTR